MKSMSVAARALGACASIAAAAGMLAGCGSSPSPSAGQTVTVTVTASPQSTATTSQPVPSPTPSGPPACATAILKAALGRGSGAAGSVYYPIVFTNTSASACSLYGYPGVSFVTASGGQVGPAATEDPVYPRQLVTLAPGGTAHAELQILDAHNYPSSTCSPIAVHRLRVFPPGQTSAVYIAVATTACANSSVHVLSVQTVQP